MFVNYLKEAAVDTNARGLTDDVDKVAKYFWQDMKNLSSPNMAKALWTR